MRTPEQLVERANKRARGICRNCSQRAKVVDGKVRLECEDCLERSAKNKKNKRSAKKLAAVVRAPRPRTKADEAREWFLETRRRQAVAA